MAVPQHLSLIVGRTKPRQKLACMRLEIKLRSIAVPVNEPPVDACPGKASVRVLPCSSAWYAPLPLPPPCKDGATMLFEKTRVGPSLTCTG